MNGARFSVPVHLEYGDRVVIVGSDPALGSWAIDNAVLLEWTDGDVWEGIVDLGPGHHEFKVIPRDQGDSLFVVLCPARSGMRKVCAAFCFVLAVCSP